MATATTTGPLTAEQFFDFVHRPENADRFFELDDGEVIEMPPPGGKHGIACMNAAWLVRDYVRRTKRGFGLGNDAGVILARRPDTVRGPDVSYFAETPASGDVPAGYLTTVPTLAIEVRSPNDRQKKLMNRVKTFLTCGVAVVWLIDPADATVTIYRAGDLPEVLDEDDELVGDPDLPDFRCKVSEFFAVN